MSPTSENNTCCILAVIYILLLGYPITAHAFAGIVELGQQILRREVASTYDASTYRDRRPIALEPFAGSGEHCREPWGSSDGLVDGARSRSFRQCETVDFECFGLKSCCCSSGSSSFPIIRSCCV